jgi:hypothetical protein
VDTLARRSFLRGAADRHLVGMGEFVRTYALTLCPFLRPRRDKSSKDPEPQYYPAKAAPSTIPMGAGRYFEEPRDIAVYPGGSYSRMECHACGCIPAFGAKKR